MNTARGFRILALIAATSAFALTTVAQNTTTPPASATTAPAHSGATTPPPPDHDHPTTGPGIKQNFDNRIADGVKDGQLTAGETAHVETDQNKLDNEAAAMKAANGGKLSAADRQELDEQSHDISKQIYNEKHNGKTASSNSSNPYGAARQNQQDRIAQGIQSGSLTPSEASKLEHQQHNTNAQVDQMRDANGGNLTPAQKQAVAQNQAKMSRNINNAKHNQRGH